MLELLRIRNMALIDDLELEFNSGLNVLTGESGAGKSFILRALDFILGARISSEMIRPGSDKSVVEAVFVNDSREEIFLRREISAQTGRSRCYINHDLSSQAKLAGLREQLLIHTSQHGQQKLLKPAYQTRIIDLFWDGKELLREKTKYLEKLRSLDMEKQDLQEQLQDLADKKDFLLYQKEEIDKIGPEPGEEDNLLHKQKTIKSRAMLTENVNTALDLIHSGAVLDNALALQKKLDEMANIEEAFSPFAEQMQGFTEYIQDLEAHLRSCPAQEGMHELEQIESRLWELSSLKRRLKRNMDQIIDLEKEIEANLSFLDQGRLKLKQIERERQEAESVLEDLVRQINSARQNACGPLKEAMEQSLRQLGFPEQIALHFDFVPEEIYPGILEQRPRIMWVPNPGQSPQPLDKIASGGELSRFLLALVGLRSEQNLPTLLFDEVDAGIGGETLTKVGKHIRNLAASRQVILITHWPQLAGLADSHFQVRKNIADNETTTTCRHLDSRESREELARMAGGGTNGRSMAENLFAG